MNTLAELELGNKALKASRIAKEIPLIKPSRNPYVWKLLDKLLMWLSSPLGASLHLTLQPLRDLIWKWFFIQQEEEQLSSLFLMDIFIRRFPSSLNSNFQSTQSLLFRALHEDNAEIQNAASHVLESILDLFQTPYVNHAISIFNEVMKSFLNLNIPLKEGYVTAISRVFVKYPEECGILKFTEPPLGRLSYSLI